MTFVKCKEYLLFDDKGNNVTCLNSNDYRDVFKKSLFDSQQYFFSGFSFKDKIYLCSDQGVLKVINNDSINLNPKPSSVIDLGSPIMKFTNTDKWVIGACKGGKIIILRPDGEILLNTVISGIEDISDIQTCMGNSNS